MQQELVTQTQVDKMFDEVFSPEQIAKKTKKVPKKTTCKYVKRGGIVCGKSCRIFPEERCSKHNSRALASTAKYVQEWKDRTQTFEKLYHYETADGIVRCVKYPQYLRALKNPMNTALGEVNSDEVALINF